MQRGTSSPSGGSDPRRAVGHSRRPPAADSILPERRWYGAHPREARLDRRSAAGPRRAMTVPARHQFITARCDASRAFPSPGTIAILSAWPPPDRSRRVGPIGEMVWIVMVATCRASFMQVAEAKHRSTDGSSWEATNVPPPTRSGILAAHHAATSPICPVRLGRAVGAKRQSGAPTGALTPVGDANWGSGIMRCPLALDTLHACLLSSCALCKKMTLKRLPRVNRERPTRGTGSDSGPRTHCAVTLWRTG